MCICIDSLGSNTLIVNDITSGTPRLLEPAVFLLDEYFISICFLVTEGVKWLLQQLGHPTLQVFYLKNNISLSDSLMYMWMKNCESDKKGS